MNKSRYCMEDMQYTWRHSKLWGFCECTAAEPGRQLVEPNTVWTHSTQYLLVLTLKSLCRLGSRRIVVFFWKDEGVRPHTHPSPHPRSSLSKPGWPLNQTIRMYQAAMGGLLFFKVGQSPQLSQSIWIDWRTVGVKTERRSLQGWSHLLI